MRHSADCHAIADADRVRPTNSDPACQNAVATDAGTADDTNAAANYRVLADVAVVTDLNLVVDFHPIIDDGIVQCASIYGAARTNANVTADGKATLLGNFMQSAPFIRSKAEPICTEHRIGVYNASVANFHTVINNGPRHHFNIGAEHASCTDNAVGMQTRAITQAGSGSDADASAHSKIGPKMYPIRKHCRSVNTAGDVARLCKQLRHTRERQIGIVDDKRIARPELPVSGPNQYRASISFQEPLAIGTTGIVRQLRRRGCLQTANSRDLEIRIADQLGAKLVGKISERERPHHDCQRVPGS